MITLRARNASRNSTSISAFTLRRSALASRSTAPSTSGSRRTKNDFRGEDKTFSSAALAVQRAGIEHGLGFAIGAEHDQQIRHHRRAPVVIELDHIAL